MEGAAVRWILCLLSVVLALGPLGYVAATVNLVDPSPEFVFYRIGDALSLRGGEERYVRPVQGIPTALLSKAIVPHIEGITTREGLRLYGLAWSSILAALVLVGIVLAWRVRIAGTAQALALALPFWAGTAAIGFIVAPEYWAGEWAYLGITFALLPALYRLSPAWAYFVIGLWAGFGAAIKITLFPIALVLAVLYGGWTWRRSPLLLFLLGVGAFVAFFLADLAYMGGNLSETFRLFHFQRHFYLQPNKSAIYGDALSAFLSRPGFVALFVSVLILAAWQRSRLALAVVAWCAVYVYLVLKRPHDSSLTSFAISLGFMAALLALQLQRKALALAFVAIVAVIGASFNRFEGVKQWAAMPDYYRGEAENAARADAFFSGSQSAWFMPSNDWNASYPSQGFAYNGGLALRPQGVRPAVYQQFFPGRFLVGTPADARKALEAGAVIFWTRRPEQDASELFRELAGARIEEQRTQYRGDAWIFGKARAE